MTTNLQQARRSFIQKSICIVGLLALPKVDIFAGKSLANFRLGSIGLDNQKILALSAAFKQNNLDLSFSNIKQKSDILFLGNITNISISEIGNSAQNHALLLVEKMDNEAKMFELKSYCHYRGIHLAEIENWVEKTGFNKVFEKLNYFEIAVDTVKIHQSIQYLDILNKLTVNNGLQIINNQ